MIRRLVAAAALLPVLAVLVGCEAGSDIVVREDGSGTYATVIAVEGPAGDKLYDAAVDAAEESGVPLKVSRYESGLESGARISCRFRSLDDLRAMAARLSGQSTGLGGVRISRGDDGWNFVASADSGLTRPPGSKDTGSTGGQIDAGSLGGLIHMTVAVELPGSPGVTNATAVTHTASTTSFKWDLQVGREASDLRAATTFVGDQGSVALATAMTDLGGDGSDDGGHLGAWVALLAAVVLLAVLLVVFLRRRRTSDGVGVPEVEGDGTGTHRAEPVS